jgi:hypothetical protein
LEAELVAVSAEAHLVRRFFSELLGEPVAEREEDPEHSTREFKVVRDE